MPRWSDIHRELADRVCPELQGTPVYFVLQADLPEGHRSRTAIAWTARTADLISRPHLESEGLWRGRGACIVVNPEQFFELPLSERQAVILHELAHVVGSWGSWLIPAEELPLLSQVALVEGGTEFIDRALAAAGLPVDEVNLVMKQHHARFVRAGLHLWRRASGSVDLGEIVLTHPRYGTGCDPWPFVSELESELTDGRDLLTVMKTPIPAGFEALFPRVE